ncbi:kunitz proteinase inhibitor, partial [Trifolium medium]|nr:kunitz proteinase inhibitor [Trifolium medium]
CAKSLKWELFQQDFFPLPWVAIGDYSDGHLLDRIMEGVFNIQKHGWYRDEKGNRLVLTENNNPFNLVFIADNSGSGRSVV